MIDDNHFDSLGAKKVTKMFREYLINNYDIPDRRNDERFSELNNDYVEWNALRTSYAEIDLNK